MRVTCERCLRRYDVPDATVKGRKIRARCKCGARVVVQDEERAAKSSASGHTTGSIQRPVRWFVDITSWEPIAMDLRQLVRAFDAGRIDAETLVWRKGMPDWRRLREVPELSDRLIGADGAAPAPPSDAPVPAQQGLASGSEPPPRQSERSRTPQANYSVKPPAAAPPGLAATSVQERAKQSAAKAEDSRHDRPRPAGSGSEQSKAASSMNLASSRTKPGEPVTLAPQQRTITQTGLAAPMEAARASATPIRSASTEGEAGRQRPSSPNNAAQGHGAQSAASQSTAAQRAQSRNPTPAGGQRRTSSDETPAQKPSSISVPPGTLLSSTNKPRNHRRIAAGALLVAGVILVQRWVVSGPAEVGQAAVGAPAVQEPPRSVEQRIEKPGTPSEETNAAPTLADPAPVAAPSVESAAPAAPARAVESAPAKAAPNAPASLSARPSEAPPTAAMRPVPEPPAENRATPAKPTVPAPVQPKVAAPVVATSPPPPASAAASAQPSEPTVAEAPSPVAPSTATPEAPSTSAPPAVEAPAAPSVAAPATVFDAAAAEVQMRVAAQKASTCGELGPTRGRGQVAVQIEKWGRVVRVTHLNQSFVGTPVGLCVMQAFQQVRVPAFEGTAQTLTSAFAVE